MFLKELGSKIPESISRGKVFAENFLSRASIHDRQISGRVPRIPQHILEYTNKIISGAFGITKFKEVEEIELDIDPESRNLAKALGIMMGGVKVMLPATFVAGEYIIPDNKPSRLRLGLGVLGMGSLSFIDLGSNLATAYFAQNPQEYMAIRGSYNLAVESLPDIIKTIGQIFPRRSSLSGLAV